VLPVAAKLGTISADHSVYGGQARVATHGPDYHPGADPVA
jgi:hypothetical protein